MSRAIPLALFLRVDTYYRQNGARRLTPRQRRRERHKTNRLRRILDVG